MMKVIVVTGGIGSGKSQVCGILHDMGITAQYNADRRVKALYDEYPGLLDRIEEALGESLRDAEGKFLPRKMADRIFGDGKALMTVESLVFPVLMDDFKDFARINNDHEYVILESATILEKPVFNGLADKTVLVDAPYETRMRRASMRDNVPEETIEARMAFQPLMNALSEGYGDPRIDAVIMNDSGLVELKERTKETILHLFDNQ